MAIYGLLRVQLAMQNVLKPSMIKESFALCGIYPLNLNQMMLQFSEALSLQEEEKMKNILPELVKKNQRTGRII
jgi:hypothetical protein